MTLDEHLREWEKDCIIDELDIAHSSARGPILHAKYLSLLGQAKMQTRAATAKYLALKGDKIKYYRGEMTQKELQDRGWQQFQGIKPLKSEMNDVLQTDEDMIKQHSRVFYLETMVESLEGIMKSINTRSFDIKNMVEWMKLQAGN